jgi:SAM-dependent methyltransferase
MTTTLLETYQELPYPASPRPLAQHHHMAAMARLRGLAPAPPEACRVLELGCSDGGNLRRMAREFPDSEFVGVDLSPLQVEHGRARAQALGLSNLRLEAADLAAVDEGWGSFDYVIAHGLYSWVTPPVADQLLAVIAARLSASGVAYLSYNTYPGWFFEGALRGMFQHCSRGLTSGADKVHQSRALLDYLATFAPEDTYRQWLTSAAERLAEAPDHYLRHDHLETSNHPVWFHELVAHAERRGLQHLDDASPTSALDEGCLPGEAREALDDLAPNTVERMQYLDFLHNRMFRRSLLVPAAAQPTPRAMPSDVSCLWVASRYLQLSGPMPDLSPGVPEEFGAQSELPTITTDHALSKAAFVELRRAWPETRAIDDLIERARSQIDGHSDPHDERAVRDHLLRAQAYGHVEISGARRAVTRAKERPRACPIASDEAQRGAHVFNLRCDRVVLTPLLRALLSELDGTGERAELCSRAANRMLTMSPADGPPPPPVEALASLVDENLDRAVTHFGFCSLLVPEPRP